MPPQLAPQMIFLLGAAMESRDEQLTAHLQQFSLLVHRSANLLQKGLKRDRLQFPDSWEEMPPNGQRRHGIQLQPSQGHDLSEGEGLQDQLRENQRPRQTRRRQCRSQAVRTGETYPARAADELRGL
jgi:hypothetical protein